MEHDDEPVQKRIKQEKEEDDNDEKKEVEVEWKTTTYQGSGVCYNQHEVVIGWPLLWGDFLRLSGMIFGILRKNFNSTADTCTFVDDE